MTLEVLYQVLSFSESKKQVVCNLQSTQWCAMYNGEDFVEHCEANCPPLNKYNWYEIILSNFYVLKEFFITLNKPNSTVDKIDDLLKMTPQMFTAKLVCDLTPLLNFLER